MKKKDEEMLPEYDFSGRKSVRGKYAKAMREGYSVRIYKGKKLVSDQFFAAIDHDVQEHFQDSKAVNKALRTLISIFPKRPNTATK